MPEITLESLAKRVEALEKKLAEQAANPPAIKECPKKECPNHANSKSDIRRRGV